MKKKCVGIIIYMLLVVNASFVLGMSEKKAESTEEWCYYIFEDSSGNRDIKYIKIYNDIENNLPIRSVSTTSQNLAPNPSFEEGDTMPTGWIPYSERATGIFHWDSNSSHSSKKSVGCLNATNNNQSAWTEIGWETIDFIPVDMVTNTYLVSGWAKYSERPPANQTGILWVYSYDKNFKSLGGYGTSEKYSPNWEYYWMSSSHFGDSYFITESKYIKLRLSLTVNFEETIPNPLVEVRFDDIYFGFENEPPNTPTITGETNGTIKSSYDYTIKTIDPDQDNVKYFIDWGDKTNTTTNFYESGAEVVLSHKWNTEGNYSIKVKAIDENFAESQCATLTITMPYIVKPPFQQFLDWLFQRFPNAFPFLRHLMGY